MEISSKTEKKLLTVVNTEKVLDKVGEMCLDKCERKRLTMTAKCASADVPIEKKENAVHGRGKEPVDG